MNRASLGVNLFVPSAVSMASTASQLLDGGRAAVGTSRSLWSLPDVGSRALEKRTEQARRRGVDVLPLRPYAEMPVPPHVRRAVDRAITKNSEAPARGLPELRVAIAEKVGTEIGHTVDPDRNVLIANGAMQALNLVFRATLDPGDEVIIPSPCYFFGGCVALAGGTPVHVPMTEAEGFAWDLDRLAEAVTSRTTAIVINTPVNPTGVVLNETELTAIATIAAERDLLIISDESFDELVYDDRRHVSIVEITGAASRTVLIKSFTKSYAMPAWRVGYLVGPPSVVEACTKALEWEQLHVGHVQQAAAAAAMEGSQDWLSGITQQFQEARDTFFPLIDSVPGLRTSLPAGGPFMFINISGAFDGSESASQALLEAGVPATPGHYCQSNDHIRVAFGADSAVLIESVERMSSIVGAGPSAGAWPPTEKYGGY